MRDAGELLDLSPQRISQVADTWLRTVASPRLFNELARADDTPARHLESTFAFLSHHGRFLGSGTRQSCQSCYAAFPARAQKPAWLAAYARATSDSTSPPGGSSRLALCDRLGSNVEVEPELRGSKNTPDFLVTKGPTSMYVEAAVVFNGDLDSDAWNWVRDFVNMPRSQTSSSGSNTYAGQHRAAATEYHCAT